MAPRDEDQAWNEIIDNYGDAPDAAALDEVPAAAPEPEPTDWNPTPWEDEGRYVPPPPPKVALAEPPRLVAWAGLVIAPLVMLLVTVAPMSVPGWASMLLLLWFVGGFGFLVATMKHEPRDPYDDGAVL